MPKNAVWFFFALFGGGACVWWSKGVFENPWIAVGIASSSVIGLLIYYILNDEDAPEEKGDNIYYLGLLFTLISLMFTLWELFGKETDAVHNTEKIRALLENFGFALVSTFLGIVGRVVVQNLQRIENRQEFAEVPESPVPLSTADIRYQYLEKLNRFPLEKIARDLNQGVNAFALFHRNVRAYASDTEDDLRRHSETLKKESLAFKETLETNAEIFAQELKSQAKNTLNAVGNSLGTVSKQAEVVLERLQSVQDGYLNEVRETTRSFHEEIRSASSQSLDLFQRNVDVAAKQSISLAQNASASSERISKAVDRLESDLGRASEASAALGNSTAKAAETTTTLELEAEKLNTTLVAVHTGTNLIVPLGQSLDSLQRNVDVAVKQSITASDRVGEALDHLETRLGQASKASEALGNSAVQAAKSTEALELEADKLRATFHINRDIKQTVAAVRQMGESFQTMTVEGATVTEQSRKVAELFDTLTQSIQRTEADIQRTAEALRDLANEAETQTNILRQQQGSIFTKLFKRQ